MRTHCLCLSEETCWEGLERESDWENGGEGGEGGERGERRGEGGELGRRNRGDGRGGGVEREHGEGNDP